MTVVGMISLLINLKESVNTVQNSSNCSRVTFNQSQLTICLVVRDRHDYVRIVAKITMVEEIQVRGERSLRVPLAKHLKVKLYI
jgi:hypothetical protein